MRTIQIIGLAGMLAGMWQATALANCPSPYPNEIFCDDFDTYCDQEGSGGHPGDPKCPIDIADTIDSYQRLREVWLREPRDADGTELTPEETDSRLTSLPFGGRYPCQDNAKYSPQTIRDWVHSPYPLSAPGQIRNLAWKIEEVFGVGNTAVVGTDDQPLVLTYMLDGGKSSKVDGGNGYMAVSLDDNDEVSKINTANTDYAFSPDCNLYCDPGIAFESMPIICAQGNPIGPLPAACPDVIENPPPIRNVVAAGVLSMMDPDPCHCGSETAHGPMNTHLNFFDGQKWWLLRSNNPYPSTGAVRPKGGSPLPPAGGLSEPGNFELNGAPNGGKDFHWITMRIKTETVVVQLTTQERDTAGNDYFVDSFMEIPRAYLGAFNSLRLGVDEGCEIRGLPENPWACGGSNTRPLRSRSSLAGALVFDDIYFHGGAPVKEEGACCHADATCTEVLSDDCDGVWRGRSTTCATLAQPCCPKMYGDTDNDNDVDIVDFSLVQRCLTSGQQIAAECRCLDFNSNGLIDSLEVEHFVMCANGPNVPGNDAAPCDGVGW